MSTSRLIATAAALALPAAALARDATCEAELFGPGLFSTDKEEWRIDFSRNGKTAYWGVSEQFFPISRQATIVVSHFVDDAWTEPEVASFSGVYPDLDPHLSPSGQSLYFSSIRPVDGQERKDVDLWVVHRLPGGGWSEPENLGPEVNSPGDDLYPSIDVHGNLYFGSDRTGSFDVWRARPARGGGYAPAVALGAGVNTAAYWEFNPEITADGRTLLFTGLNRPDGHGLGDIYVSRLEGDDFGPAENLGPCVNSALDEYHPTLSHDGRTLFFIRHSYAPWIPGDFYRVELR
jgi:hypothetical protein